MGRKEGVFFLIILCPFLYPVIVISMVSTVELSDRAVVLFIQTDNKNNKTRWNFQSYQSEWLEQCGIKRAVIKQAQKRVQEVK